MMIGIMLFEYMMNYNNKLLCNHYRSYIVVSHSDRDFQVSICLQLWCSFSEKLLLSLLHEWFVLPDTCSAAIMYAYLIVSLLI